VRGALFVSTGSTILRLVRGLHKGKGVLMVEIHLEESDRLDWALKAFKRKIAKAGILKDLRKKRYYVKPSEARQLKAAAARRRSRTERSR
jgi:small subunit ribosomal protein S21